MNFFTFLRKHILYIIGIILFLIGTGFLLLLSPIKNPVQVESQEILLCGISLNNWGIWITIIGAILASLWAIYEYSKSVSFRQQEKASEIAKSFSESLTTKCFIICQVFFASKLNSFLVLNEKSYDSFKFFNTNEIRTIYNDDNFIEKYIQEFKQSSLDQIYYRMLDSRISFNTFNSLTESNKIYSEKEAKELFKLNNSNFPFKFSALITNVLNELEYLCMSLSSQSAGSRYVYQSLHQIFLRTIRTLSLEIAIANQNCYTDKYYTSIINVYNEWTNLYIKYYRKEKKQKDKINKIMEPKIKTV